jgi:hypothetical protein
MVLSELLHAKLVCAQLPDATVGRLSANGQGLGD